MMITERTKLSGYAVTLDEAKSWLRVDIGSDDSLIQLLIESAELMFEDYTGLFVSEEEVKFTTSEYEVRMPYLPALSIASEDADGNAETFDYDAGSGYITFDVGGEHNVTYAGKGQLEAYKAIILQIVALLYENRGDTNADVDISKVNGIEKYTNKLWI